MPLWASLLAIALVALVAGAVGGLLGLGGGLFIVPTLVVLFGFDIHVAVAASLICITGTSTGAALVPAQRRTADLRLGTFLEVGTAAGGISGALLSVELLRTAGTLLILAFVPVVLLAALVMYRGIGRDASRAAPPDALARRLRLRGQYFDEEAGRDVTYRVGRTPAGVLLAILAGVTSGLFGIGGGLFKVPAMNATMGVPLRVAIATSNYMLGITAAAGAVVYLVSGDVVFGLVGPVALGTLAGSAMSARLPRKTPTRLLKAGFIAVLVFAAFVMLLRGLGVVA